MSVLGCPQKANRAVKGAVLHKNSHVISLFKKVISWFYLFLLSCPLLLYCVLQLEDLILNYGSRGYGLGFRVLSRGLECRCLVLALSTGPQCESWIWILSPDVGSYWTNKQIAMLSIDIYFVMHIRQKFLCHFF